MMKSNCNAQRLTTGRWVTGLAGVAAAASPLTADAAIVSNASLDYQVGIGETYYLPGLADFKFALNSGVKLQVAGPGGARLGMNYLIADFCGWGEHAVGPSFNCNPGYVGAGVFNGPHADTQEGGLTYGGGGTFSGTSQDSGYLGFIFERDDGQHFGWVEVTVETTGSGWQFGGDYSLTVHGYGYETTPGVGIYTGQVANVPEPSSLALAAAGIVGAAAGAARRRRKTAAAA
jgi:hypothetical protein